MVLFKVNMSADVPLGCCCVRTLRFFLHLWGKTRRPMSIIPFFQTPSFFSRQPWSVFDDFNNFAYTATTNANQYTYEVPVPGMTKNNVEVYLDGNMVVVDGQRGQSRVKYAFSLPRNADAQKLSATVRDGLLIITAPRLANDRSKTAKKISVQ